MQANASKCKQIQSNASKPNQTPIQKTQAHTLHTLTCPGTCTPRNTHTHTYVPTLSHTCPCKPNHAHICPHMPSPLPNFFTTFYGDLFQKLFKTFYGFVDNFITPTHPSSLTKKFTTFYCF